MGAKPKQPMGRTPKQPVPAVALVDGVANAENELPKEGLRQAIKGIYWRHWVLAVTAIYSVTGAIQWIVGFLPPKARAWLESITPSLSAQQWICIGIALFVVITTFGAVSEVMRRDKAWRTELGKANHRIAHLTDKARRAKVSLESRRIDEQMKLLLGSNAPGSYLEVFCECFVVRVMSFEFGTRDICISGFGTTTEFALAYTRGIRDFFVQEGVIERNGEAFRLADPGRELLTLLKEESVCQHTTRKAERAELSRPGDNAPQPATNNYRDAYMLAMQHLINTARSFQDSGKCTEEEYNKTVASTQYMISGLQDAHAAVWNSELSRAPFMTMIPDRPMPQAFIGLLHQWLVRFQERVDLDRVKPTFEYTSPQ